MTIYFYTKSEPNFGYSNFSRFGVDLDDKWWPTVEHYFQAQKFNDIAYQEKIRSAHSPKEAANLGRSRELPVHPNWDQDRLEVMRRAVSRKFQLHSELRSQLLMTGDEEIVENAPGDYFWGCGMNGTGENWLGKIIMEIRDELRKAI